MLFLKIDSSAPVMSYISGEIKAALDGGKKVLWLVPGGSGLDIAVLIADEIKENPHLSNLTLGLTDERYGKPGHEDSNWKQLTKKGFRLEGAKLLPVLSGEPIEVSVKNYADKISRELEQADFSVALAGMGADGHILGIKPSSPAVGTKAIAEGYKWDDYERITFTYEALKQLDEVVIYAVGKEKWPQFDKLSEDLPAEQQPAQLLKKLKKVTIFNDYIEAV